MRPYFLVSCWFWGYLWLSSGVGTRHERQLPPQRFEHKNAQQWSWRWSKHLFQAPFQGSKFRKLLNTTKLMLMRRELRNTLLVNIFLILGKSTTHNGWKGEKMDNTCLAKAPAIPHWICGTSRHSWYSCASIVSSFPVTAATRQSISGATMIKPTRKSQIKAQNRDTRGDILDALRKASGGVR